MYVPSFWDYLAQGGNQLLDNFKEERNRRQQQTNQENAFLNQLFQSGAVGSADLQEGLARGKVNVRVQPNQADIVRQFEDAPWMFNDQRRAVRGLPSRSSVMQEGAQQQLIPAQLKSTLAKTRLEGEQAAAELPNVGAAAEARRLDPVLKTAASWGENFAADYIARNKGKIHEGNISQIIEQAVRGLDRSGLRRQGYQPTDEENLRGEISKAVIGVWQRQQALDNNRLHALAAGERANNTGQKNLYPTFIALKNSAMKAVEQQLSGPLGAALQLYEGKDINTIDPSLRGAVERYRAAQRNVENIESVTQQYMSGALTEQQAAQLLGGTGVVPPQGGGQASMGVNTTGATQPQHRGKKRIITPDQKAYLESIGAWDSSTYEVRP